MHKIIGQNEICEITGLSRSTIWRMERDGQFPKRRQVSPSRIGWLSSEINEWLDNLGRNAVGSDSFGNTKSRPLHTKVNKQNIETLRRVAMLTGLSQNQVINIGVKLASDALCPNGKASPTKTIKLMKEAEHA